MKVKCMVCFEMLARFRHASKCAGSLLLTGPKHILVDSYACFFKSYMELEWKQALNHLT